MRKILALLLCLTFLPVMALADNTLSIETPAETVRPGKAVLLCFDVPASGTISLYVQDDDGENVSVVVENHQAAAGTNAVYWNGTWQGVPAPEGNYSLVLVAGDSVATAPVTIGSYAPYLHSISVVNENGTPDAPVQVNCTPSEAGMIYWGLQQDGEVMEQSAVEAEAGESCELTWQPEGNLPDGTYTLVMWLEDETGFSSTVEQVEIQLTGFEAEEVLEESEPAEETVTEDMPEEIVTEEVLEDEEETADAAAVTVDAAPEAEATVLTAVEETAFDLEVVETTDIVYTPSYGSPYTEAVKDYDYWTTPMDITDTEAIWNMLTSSITVLDNGKKNAQKQQIVLRKEPDENSAGVGVVTCISQSVRVLETLDNGWALVESYSSSFHDNKVQAWNMLVQGYVQTKYMKTVTPNQEIGLVVDKLTQRLYIFKDGELYDTLLVSTGLANAKQPYNETRSGEFLLMLPAMGGFKSDNLVCSMGIRFNDGDVLHEVPHTVNGDGSSNYSTCEPKLGVKASHGCVRVQRRKTPKGTNMSWLWDTIRATKGQGSVKIVIWEDWQGRQIAIPSDDTVLYYNPDGGKQYHSAETCNSAKGKTFTAFTYGELETGDFAKLTRCEWCTPPLRISEIEEINATYAIGGDHDPVMTAARQKWIDSQQAE